MDTMRKPFQGIENIVRFNWHFYLAAFLICFISFFIFQFFCSFPWSIALSGLILLPVFFSLAFSWYIYDLSGFYSLKWLDDIRFKEGNIVNIHAGFDETSQILEKRFPLANLVVYDFYDPAVHTELSIKRARKAVPMQPDTISISTRQLPLDDRSADFIFLIFAAHEIRNDEERIVFFKELNRVLKNDGRVIIVEHLRDLPNFIAYTVGFFHFLSKSAWLRTINQGGFMVEQAKQINPFVKYFNIMKDGNSN